MRTRLAILLAAVVAFTLVASALMTSQLGMRDWPTAPTPDTATRLITPSEAAGRTADASSSDSGDDTAAESAQRVDADRADGRPGAKRRATTPVRTHDRERRPATDRTDTDEAPEAEPAVTEPDAPSAPAATPATGPAVPAPSDDGQHTRDDEQSTAPGVPSAPTLVPNPPSIQNSDEPPTDDRRRGPLRDLLDPLS
jgi:hypothetical protein